MSLKITEETTFLLDMTNEQQFGPVLNVSNCENDSYTTFGSATPTGFNAESDANGTDRAGTADEIAIVSGSQYNIAFTLALNSGPAPFFDLRATPGISASVEGNQLSTVGSNSFDFTCDTTTTGLALFENDNAATNFEITNLSVRLIL